MKRISVTIPLPAKSDYDERTGLVGYVDPEQSGEATGWGSLSAKQTAVAIGFYLVVIILICLYDKTVDCSVCVYSARMCILMRYYSCLCP